MVLFFSFTKLNVLLDLPSQITPAFLYQTNYIFLFLLISVSFIFHTQCKKKTKKRNPLSF
uniref:Uncharacterized protein n=1 Tax=Octopus bimaculoides TaxID=37653 RepID=A0A0L8I461_OCTBM